MGDPCRGMPVVGDPVWGHFPRLSDQGQCLGVISLLLERLREAKEDHVMRFPQADRLSELADRAVEVLSISQDGAENLVERTIVRIRGDCCAAFGFGLIKAAAPAQGTG